MRSFFSRFSAWMEASLRGAQKRRRAARALTQRHNARLELEPLESRIVLSSYVVTSSLASGAGSLAAEISAAVTANDTNAQITFNLPSDTTISLASSNSVSAAAQYGPTAFFIDGSSGTNITINGAGATGLAIAGNNSVRLFAVAAGNALTLESLTVQSGLAQGGAGGSSNTGGGGGGGAGLGGAVFDDGGSFTALGCTFTNDIAQGGQGGLDRIAGSDGGGGGGLGANSPGGNGTSGPGVGGGVHGGQNDAGAGFGGGGEGGGGGGNSNNGYGGGFGGGGGGGSTIRQGGVGGFGGGGGGGGANDSGGSGGFGGGHGQGGGVSSYQTPGGGTSYSAYGGEGGGGAGLGGGIFARGGSITLTGNTFSGNSALGGTGANNGSGDGPDLFTVSSSLQTSSNSFAGETGTDNVASTGFYEYTPPVAQLLVSVSPGSLTAGGATSVTITAEDAYNDIISGFSDSIALSDSLGGASFGAVSFAGGKATLTATLDTVGTQTITANDSSATIAGTSNSISVSPAAASGFLINSNSPSATVSGSLGFEIAAAVAAGGSNTITFASGLAGETIALGSGNTISAAAQYGPTAYFINGNSGTSITINAASAPGLVIDGGGAVRLFAVTSGDALTLENLTVQNGLAQGGAGGTSHGGGAGGGGAGMGGAVFDDGGSFTAVDCTFTNDTAQGGAGGSITGTASVSAGGGGLGATSAGANASGGTAGAGGGIHGGTASSGAGGVGGPGGYGGGGGGTVNNRLGGVGGFGGGGGGGGISGNVGVTGGIGGFGGGGGGGGRRFGGGATGGFGGGNGGLGGGTGGAGGAGGGGGGLGGGIFSNGGTIALTNDTFTADSAAGGLGGADTSGGGTGTIGSGYGGAVFVRNGTLTATFDTFTSNTAAQGGTDIYVYSDASNGGNSTSIGSGAATATLVNDILGQSNNAVSDFVANINFNDENDTLSLAGSENDLISNNPAGTGLTGTNIVVGNPNLSGAGLHANGGPTETIALTSFSTLAIEQGATGTGITTDQRGVTRLSPPSLGADEYFPLLVTTSPSSLTAGNTASITITAVDQNGDILTSFSDSVTLSDSLGGASFTTVSFTNGKATATGTLDKAGTQNIIATDPTGTLSGTSSPVTVAPAAASHFLVSFPSPSLAPTPSASYTAGVDGPDALVVDSSGNLYVADRTNNTVEKFAPGSTVASVTYTAGVSEPDALALDSSGNLYVANYGNNTVEKFAFGSTTASAEILRWCLLPRRRGP